MEHVKWGKVYGNLATRDEVMCLLNELVNIPQVSNRGWVLLGQKIWKDFSSSLND